MQPTAFYQNHLDQVSRSFAFCIRKLEEPLRMQVSLSYLLCRVLDTIEDSNWSEKTLQLAHYELFESFIESVPEAETVNRWVSSFPDSIPESEKNCLKDSFLLFQDLHAQAPAVYQIIRNTVLRMDHGMRHYSTGELKLKNLKEVNQYCYFVAGVVGELLTKLFLEYRPSFQANPDLMKDAFHFGLFLQKINLLKDQLGDEKEGRFLIPSRELVMESVRENARGSLRYLTALPKEEAGFRTFCAWSLFLGLATIPFMQESYSQGSGIKISRDATEALLSEIEKIVSDDQAILAQGEECLALIPKAKTALKMDASSHSQNDEWFHKISGDVLRREELNELGITG
jgi:phytoene/squalene synthetase